MHLEIATQWKSQSGHTVGSGQLVDQLLHTIQF